MKHLIWKFIFIELPSNTRKTYIYDYAMLDNFWNAFHHIRHQSAIVTWEEIEEKPRHVYFHFGANKMHFWQHTCQQTSDAGRLKHRKSADFALQSSSAENTHLCKSRPHQNLKNSGLVSDFDKLKEAKEPSQTACEISPIKLMDLRL